MGHILQLTRSVRGGGGSRGEEGGRNKKEGDWWSHLNYKYVPGVQNRNTGLLPGTKVGFGSRPRGTSAAAPAHESDCFVIQITEDRSNSIGYEHRSLDPVPEQDGDYMQIRVRYQSIVYMCLRTWLCKLRQTQNVLGACRNLIRNLFIMRKLHLDLPLCHISAIASDDAAFSLAKTQILWETEQQSCRTTGSN